MNELGKNAHERCEKKDHMDHIDHGPDIKPPTFTLRDDTTTSLRLHAINQDLYLHGWRAAQIDGGYVVFHPSTYCRTGVYMQLDAAARAAELLSHGTEAGQGQILVEEILS